MFEQGLHLLIGLARITGTKCDCGKYEIRLRRIRPERLGTLHKTARLLELPQLQMGLCRAQRRIKTFWCLRQCLFEIPDRFGRAVDSEIDLAGQNADTDFLLAILRFQRFEHRNRVFVTLSLYENTRLTQEPLGVFGARRSSQQSACAYNAKKPA